MSVITDFARYPEFLADMEEAVVVESAPRVWTVRFAVRIIRRIPYTLRLVQESDLSLTWSLVEGMFRANNGRWELAPIPSGTRATYTLDLDIGVFVPGSVMKTLLGKNLPGTLEAFKKRAESGD